MSKLRNYINQALERHIYIHENNLKSFVSLKEIHKTLLLYTYESKGKQE